MGMSNGFSFFASVVRQLGTLTKINDKKQVLVRFFSEAEDADKVWLIALFSGRRPRRMLKSSFLSEWCREEAGIPDWLFAECYHTVGDLAETLSLLLPETTEEAEPFRLSLAQTMEAIRALAKVPETIQSEQVRSIWKKLNKDQRFVFNKLLTGNFRIGVSQQLMIQALAEAVNRDVPGIAHRISGNWDPYAITFEELIQGDGLSEDPSKPYPFYLAYALDMQPETLGLPSEWQAEWKWDGIRGQVVKRKGELFIWSRGEELMTDRFPELQVLKALPDGTVLDGEIMCLHTDPSGGWSPLPFSLLQTRIGRKTVSRKQLEQSPVGFVCYDLLEWQGMDFRERSLSERRQLLEALVAEHRLTVLVLSEALTFTTWQELVEWRGQSRAKNSEGLMLKRNVSVYQSGRKRGDWFKWKIDPLTIDGVMIYAQKGHGRRSNLFTDYTFAVRDGERLVPFAKAYSGLTDKEFAEVDAFVKQHALEKFGPVRTVKPELVFEIAFEGIAESSRHKSGVALRFPRISRWRRDKPVSEINTLEDLRALLNQLER